MIAHGISSTGRKLILIDRGEDYFYRFRIYDLNDEEFFINYLTLDRALAELKRLTSNCWVLP